MTDFITGLLFTIATGISWGFIGVLFKRAVTRNIDFTSMMIFSSSVTSVATFIFLVDYSAFHFSNHTRLIGRLSLVMAGAAILSAVGFILMRKAMEFGHSGMVWATVQSAMVIPALVSIIFLGEPLTFFTFSGLILIVSSIMMFSVSRQDHSPETIPQRSWLAYALAACFLVGIAQALCTLPSSWSMPSEIAVFRIPFFSAGTLLSFAAFCAINRRRIAPSALRPGIAYGMAGLLSQILLFISLDQMAVTNRLGLVYPIAVGTCVVSFSLYSIFVIYEPCTRFVRAGLGGVVLGIVLLSIT